MSPETKSTLFDGVGARLEAAAAVAEVSEDSGITVIPDILANAGGVTVS